jgi:L-rhamnose mutarotase
MTASKKLILMALFAALILSLTGCAQKEIKRVGMVVQLNDEHMDAYKKLHADSNPGVRDLLTKYNMANFSIFLHEIDGKWYEFGYYEYVGDDFEADMAALDAEPRNKEWLKICDPMQIPLEGETGWAEMERVYFNP